MTGYGTIEEAVKAIKYDTFHCMTKPFNTLDEIGVVMKKILREGVFEQG